VTPLFGKHITLRNLLYYSAIVFATSVVVAYTLFQARFILSGPTVAFTNEVGMVQQERVVTLEGSAENIVKLTLNGRQIYTDKSGYFKEALVLENGYTIATVEAHDRYGRVRRYTKEFVYVSVEPMETE